MKAYRAWSHSEGYLPLQNRLTNWWGVRTLSPLETRAEKGDISIEPNMGTFLLSLDIAPTRG